MALTESAQKALDSAVEVLSKEGYTVWGLILPRTEDAFYPFSNVSADVGVMVHNFEEGARALRESYNIQTHEA